MSLVKKSITIFFLFWISTCLLFAQEYVAFEEEIDATIIGDRIFVDKDGLECSVKNSSKIKIIGRGYNKESGKYWFKSGKCFGYISELQFIVGKEFEKQNVIAAGRIYEIRNAQALKEMAEESSIIKNKCSYRINEVDVFDKVRVIETLPKKIADDLHLILYEKGGKKKLVFSSLDLGCTSSYENNRSWVKIMLKNNDVITFYHSGKLDCGNFDLWGNISSSEILRLQKSPIAAIRMQGTEYEHTIKKLDWPTFFIDQLKCYNSEQIKTN